MTRFLTWLVIKSYRWKKYSSNKKHIYIFTYSYYCWIILQNNQILVQRIVRENHMLGNIQNFQTIYLSNKISEIFRTGPSWINLEMDSKLPRSNRNGPRVADSNPDSIANKNLEKAEANIKYQDSLISRMQRVAQDDPRTNDLTKPTTTKDSSEK